MKKALKFSKFDTKKKIIQYSLISVALIFLSFHIFNRGQELVKTKRVELITKYSYEVTNLKEDKAENLKKIEDKYDEKIEKLESKIKKLNKKVYE